jgi:hypothetical protein
LDFVLVWVALSAGVESGAVHLKFRFQPVDMSQRPSIAHVFRRGSARKRSRQRSEDGGDQTKTKLVREQSRKWGLISKVFRSRPKGTKIRLKDHASFGHESASSSDDDSEGGVGKSNEEVSDDENFDFGTDDEVEEWGSGDANAAGGMDTLESHALSTDALVTRRRLLGVESAGCTREGA